MEKRNSENGLKRMFFLFLIILVNVAVISLIEWNTVGKIIKYFIYFLITGTAFLVVAILWKYFFIKDVQLISSFMVIKGQLKYKFGNYRGALIYYSKAIEINPKNEDAYNKRGFMKAQFKNYQESILDFNKLLEINPNYAIGYSNRGASKSILGDYQAAILDYDKSLELNPISSEAFLGRGIAKIDLGDKSSGCTDLRKAVALGNVQANKLLQCYLQ